MPRGRKTPLHLAATAQAMHDQGYPTGAIADATHLPQQTISDILSTTQPQWRDYLSNPGKDGFGAMRSQQKRVLQAAAIDLARQALAHMERTLPKASARDAAVVYGITRQHERLDAGEATEHVALLARHELIGLDQLAQRLSVELIRRSQAAGAGEGDERPDAGAAEGE